MRYSTWLRQVKLQPVKIYTKNTNNKISSKLASELMLKNELVTCGNVSDHIVKLIISITHWSTSTETQRNSSPVPSAAVIVQV